MLKKIILIAILIFNVIFCCMFFLIKGFEAIDLYFAHTLFITFIIILIHTYELKFGMYSFMQEVDNLIDLPITKAEATLWDLKVLYQSPLLLTISFMNYFIVFTKLIIFKDGNLVQISLSIFFSLSIVFMFINVASFFKGLIGFQAYTISFFTFIFIVQFLNSGYYSILFYLPTNLYYWIFFLVANTSLLFLRRIIFKNWIV